MRTLTASLLTLALAASAQAAPAPEAPAPEPKGPPPAFRVVKMNDKGDLVGTVTVPVTRYAVEKRQIEVFVNGMKEVREVAVPVAVTAMQTQTTVYSGKGLRASTADGKPVDAKALAARLARPTLVLVSADGRPVDPAYLRLLAKGTLVIVPGPAPASPLPAPLPPGRP
jgi:hypothetical protein